MSPSLNKLRAGSSRCSSGLGLLSLACLGLVRILLSYFSGNLTLLISSQVPYPLSLQSNQVFLPPT